jgi:Carboxypeptidase regulatory-like domain/TonB dependent receptor-like, beta-barrel
MIMRKPSASFFVPGLLLLLMALPATLAWGQGFTAEVLGTVTDNSGASVPQAIISATNSGTGLKTTAVTDAKGSYTLPQLQPGNYSITVEASGFKRYFVEKLTLQVDQRQDLDVKLELGQVSETVNVTSEAPPIQTETATVGGVVTNDQTAELPLNGRNFLELNLTLPGAAQPVKGSQLSTQGGAIEVHGQPENSNYFWLDGLDNTTQTIGQFIINVPSYSIQEFRVMSPTYDAEFGRTPGGNINVITRGGQNALHGDLYLFLRNSYFDAKNYFDPPGTIPAFRRGQYGADIGGKIMKDKLFFYGAFEGLNFAQGESAKAIVPSVQETLGNFSDITAKLHYPGSATLLPNNTIPTSMLNQTGLAIAHLFPAPNQGTNTLLVSPVGTDRDDVSVIKSDYVMTTKDRWSIKTAFELPTFNQPISQFSANTNIPGFGIAQLGVRDITTGLSETHIFSPTLISEVRVGWNRFAFNYVPYARYQDWCGILGIQGCDEGPANWNMPSVSFSSTYASLGGASNQTEPGPFDTTFVDPTITWIKGKHMIKMGGDFHHFLTNFGNGQGPRGTFTFNGTWTGNPLADLLFGFPYQATKTVITNQGNPALFLMSMKSAAGFVQDDYRVNSHLTLNFGLRYEYNFPAIELRNILANMNLSNGVANAQVLVSGNTSVGGYAAAGTNQLYNGDRKQFAPRFGFAYTPKDNWVIRGGYGIFYQLVLENTPQGLHYTVPFQYGYTIVGNGTTININDALVTGLTANVPSFSALAQYLKAGMIQQFSLGFQHQLPGKILIDASYVGNRGRNIDANEAINTPAPGPGTVQSRRVNPNFAGINLYCPCVTSQYDGLEVRVKKSLAQAGELLSSFTWSRSFDDAGTPQDPNSLAGQWGPSSFDIPIHLSISYVYHLPLGRGQKFLSGMNGFGNAILGGWQANGIYQYHSGQPFSVILPTDNSNTLQNQDRPNITGDPYQSSATCTVGTPTCWINPAAFTVPAKYTFGTAGKNEFRGPTFSQLDFSLTKNFTFKDKYRVEFRAEAFNILNKVNFDNPTSSSAQTATLSSTFGVITSAESSRQLQFGARFNF